MQSVPDSGLSQSQPAASMPDQDALASQGSAGARLPHSKAPGAVTEDATAEGAQAGSQPLQQAGASVSNACAGIVQGDVGFLENSPWRVKRRKENSAPSSPEQLAKRAKQGLFASTPAGSSLGQWAAGQPNSLPAHQDHVFSQEAAAAGKSLMAALRAAGISPRSSDAPRSSDVRPGSDDAAPMKAPSASLSTVHGAEPLPPGNASGGFRSAASNSMSQPSGDGLRKASSRAEAPMQISSLSDKMDMVDVAGLSGTAAVPPAAGLGTRAVPSSARSAHHPSQPDAAEAQAGAVVQQPKTEGGAAAAQARQAPGTLSQESRPHDVQRPVNADAHDLRAEGPAAARLTKEGTSHRAEQAVSLSRGDAPAAEHAAAVLPTVLEDLTALPRHHAPAAAGAGSQAAARSGAGHGPLSQSPLKQGRVGSAQDPHLSAVQPTLVCTEVQAVPSTMVEALPPPQVASVPHAEAAAAHASEGHDIAGATHSQHGNSGMAAAAGHHNSQPLHQQVKQVRPHANNFYNCQLPPMRSMAIHTWDFLLLLVPGSSSH